MLSRTVRTVLSQYDKNKNKFGQYVAQVFFLRTNVDAWGFSVRTQNVQNSDKIARNDFTFSSRNRHFWLFFNFIFHFLFSIVAAYLSQYSAKTKMNSIINKIEEKRTNLYFYLQKFICPSSSHFDSDFDFISSYFLGIFFSYMSLL